MSKTKIEVAKRCLMEPGDRRDFCRLCCRLVPVATLDQSGACAGCLRDRVKAVMPLVMRGDWELYNTRRVFTGFRVFKVRQGEGPEYQEEARSPHGCFYAAGEAWVAFETKPGKPMLANRILQEFPEVRRFVSGDDGVNVLHMPAGVFPAVAARVRAYRKRVVTEEQRQRLKAAGAECRFQPVDGKG